MVRSEEPGVTVAAPEDPEWEDIEDVGDAVGKVRDEDEDDAAGMISACSPCIYVRIKLTQWSSSKVIPNLAHTCACAG